MDTPTKDPSEEHDLDLGDGHWFDWSSYEGERCGGIITHIAPVDVENQSGFCQGAITIKGSKFHQAAPERASWTFSDTEEEPTFTPSFLCHCGDHGFIQKGKWVRA